MATNHGTFTGEPLLRWLTEADADRKMQLEEDFSFTDPEGITWTVPKGHVVDGATIPRPLWSLVGSPYTGDYRRASIIHDKGCEDANGNQTLRRKADRIFYHGCRAGGCEMEEARILYLGVRFGALAEILPLWEDAMTNSRSPRAQISLRPSESQIISDFQQVAELLQSQTSTDDPLKLETSVDEALQSLAHR